MEFSRSGPGLLNFLEVCFEEFPLEACLPGGEPCIVGATRTKLGRALVSGGPKGGHLKGGHLKMAFRGQVSLN